MLKHQQKGFSTLEILIAFAIMITAISGVIITSFGNSGINNVSFGNQATSLSSETNAGAIYLAQYLIENARASSSHSNFADIISIPAASVSGDIYTNEAKVIDIDPSCKQVNAFVRWKESSRSLATNLTTLLTDPAEAMALGSGVCLPPGSLDFKTPKSFGGGVNAPGVGTSIDVINKTVFLGAKFSDPKKDDFYVVDATDKSDIKVKFSINTGYGVNALDAVVSGSYYYVFAAEASNNEQFQVIKGPTDFSVTPTVIARRKLPGVTGTCPNTCPHGRSIFYYNQRLYIGIHRLTANGAAEFHVYDVSSPNNPKLLGTKGGTALGDAVDHNINKIWVKDQTIGGVSRTYAYLATSGDTKEIIVLNVTDPKVAGIPDPADTVATGSNFNIGSSTVNDIDADSLYVIGNKAYVGRDRATGTDKDFYILDVTHPEALAELGSIKLNLNSVGSYVSGIRVTSNLAFVGTSDPNNPFTVYDISQPSNIVKYNTNACNFSTYPTDLVYEYPNVYVSVANNDTFMIIDPINGNSSCK